MNKATVDSVMEFVRAVRVAGAAQIIEPCEANIGELEIANAALRAEVERLADQAEPAPAPVGEYPALPEPSSTAYIQGHSGGEYRTLSDSYEPDCAMFSPQQMHAYIDADRAQRPDREVRLLTSKDIDDVRKTLWRDAQMNLSDLHAEDAAKAFQCKFCEVNGLTVKDQS